MEEQVYRLRAGETARRPSLDGARRAAIRGLGLREGGIAGELEQYAGLARDLLDTAWAFVVSAGPGGLLSPATDAHEPDPTVRMLCHETVAAGGLMLVSDVHGERSGAPVGGHAGSFAGVALTGADDTIRGVLCAVDRGARGWTARDARTLTRLGAALSAHLDARTVLAERSLRDPLTGLPNRTLLCSQLDTLMASAATDGEAPPFALSVGIDGFGLVNEAFGPAVGDGVLQALAIRLEGELTGAQVIGRLEGDTFAVVGPGPTRTEALAATLTRAVGAEPVEVLGQRIGLTATAGSVVDAAPRSGGTGVLARAEQALRAAKERRGIARRVPVPAGAGSAARLLELRAGIAAAVERGELRVVHQPIVDLAEGHTVGHEALARWSSAELGDVAPAEFIPVAEQTGAIAAIGDWVLDQAAAQLARRRSRNGADPSEWVSVNLSPLQLQTPEIVGTVRRALARHDLAPSALVLELTESALVGPEGVHEATVAGLRELGVRVVLDDFGTGYSALAYLKRFRVDGLKIDRAFVAGLENDRHDVAVVQTVLALARRLDLQVIAEGVETEGQRDLLNALGCRQGQGYLFGRPAELSDTGTPSGR